MSRKLVLPIIIIVAALAVIVPQAVEEMRRVRTGGATSETTNNSSSARAQGSERREEGDGRSDDERNNNQSGDLPERDEQRETFQLEPGAQVEIEDIDGIIEVETTSEGNTAEVHVVTSSNSRAYLDRRRLIFEHSPTSLTVRGESGDFSSIWRIDGGARWHQRVTLRVPRRIEFSAVDIGGRTRVGEIDGSVTARDINGNIEIAGARGRAEIVQVNGRVNLTMQDMSNEGIGLSRINGGVEVRFAGEVNADVQATRNNGAVEINLPNVTMQERQNRSNFRARIGTGGPLIRVTGVNGRVRLVPRTSEATQ